MPRCGRRGCVGAHRSSRASRHETGYVLASELRAHGVDLPSRGARRGPRQQQVIGGPRFPALPKPCPSSRGRSRRACVGRDERGRKTLSRSRARARRFSPRAPVDDRPYADLELADLVPSHDSFARGCPRSCCARRLSGLDTVASFSPVVEARPRDELRFDGLVFSDDLSMEGRAPWRDRGARGRRAQRRMDMFWCSTTPWRSTRSMEASPTHARRRLARLARLHGRSAPIPGEAEGNARYVDALHAIAAGQVSGELPLA